MQALTGRCAARIARCAAMQRAQGGAVSAASRRIVWMRARQGRALKADGAWPPHALGLAGAPPAPGGGGQGGMADPGAARARGTEGEMETASES